MPLTTSEIGEMAGALATFFLAISQYRQRKEIEELKKKIEKLEAAEKINCNRTTD